MISLPIVLASLAIVLMVKFADYKMDQIRKQERGEK